MVLRKLAGGLYHRMMDNKTNRKFLQAVKESVVAAEEAGQSPYEDDFRDLSLHAVLAMLVDGVYYRDNADYDFGVIVKPLIEGEYEVDERMAHFTSKLYWTRLDCIDEEEEKEAKVKHYIRHSRNPNKHAPSLVIAIRGTKPSKCLDLLDDIKISMATLHTSSRFERARDLVKRIIEAYSPPPAHQKIGCNGCRLYPIPGPHYVHNQDLEYNLCQRCFLIHGGANDYTMMEKPEGGSSSATDADIYITGHSLGASLALLIGKSLATVEEQRYNVHCFNPPFLTIAQLVHDGALLHKAKDLLRKTPLESLMNVASDVKNLAKFAVASAVNHEKQLVWEMVHFMHLKDWVPVLYINSYDSICKKFRKYYKQKQRMCAGFQVSTQALLSHVIGRRALFSTLLPSVDMRVHKREEAAHALKNWYRYPAIDKENQFRLLPGVSLAGYPIHELLQSIRCNGEELSLEDELLDEELLEVDQETDIDSDEDA